MRVERIAKDKVRIFISYDDLEERGIDRSEIWKNGRKMQELFWDMMETAYTELGFEISGPIAVEAFTMPSEGVVVIVTRVPSLLGHHKSEDNTDEMDDLSYPSSSFVFAFPDFEEVVRIAHALSDYEVGARLYAYNDVYYMFIEEDSLKEETYEVVWAMFQEYGEYSTVTLAVLEEYGKPIFSSNAIAHIVHHFPL
ncbi:MAG: adaptor protein MecA [Alicyclobacillus sp.]|nr:adaptor protein MecA [Alicyclobacillus sp.]